MFEELPEYLTVDWLKIGGFLKGADDNQNVMIEEVGSIAIDDFVSEQETTLSVVTNQFNFVHIIVSGEPFKTLKETLERYPNTLLGSNQKELFWDPVRQAYVFTNRCRLSFEAILYFYQSGGLLSQPKNVYCSTFIEEVDFFQIPNDSIRIVANTNNNKRTTTLNKNSSMQWKYKNETTERKKIIYPPSNVRYTKLYSTIFGGRTWTYKVVMACDLVATLLFVFCHVVSTITTGQTEGEQPQQSAESHENEASGHDSDHDQGLIPEPYGSVIEGMCVLWIMIHYFAGLVVAEEKYKYIKSFMSMVDAIIVVAVIIDNILHWHKVSNPTPLPLRAIGVLRLFNLARHSTLLYCLGLALRQSFSDLLHVVGVIIFIMFLAAGFVYFAEQPPCGKYDIETKTCLYNDSWIGTDDCKFHRECTNNRTKYVSIFASSYWAAVTITTVGYGDMIPKTTFGKIVGSILALIGLPLIAIPMPLIMTKFEKLYTTVKEQQNEELKNHHARVAEEHKNHNCDTKNHNNNWNEKQTSIHDRIDNVSDIRRTSNTSSYDSLAESPINARHERSQEAVNQDYNRINENGGEVKDTGNMMSRNWADSYKNVYGRCPTGDCQQMDCRSCRIENVDNSSPTKSEENGHRSS